VLKILIYLSADSRSFVGGGLIQSLQSTAMMCCCAVVDNVQSLEQSVLDEFRHSPPEQFKDDHQGQGPGQGIYYCYL